MNIFRTTFYLALLLSAVNATKEQDAQLIKAAKYGDEGKVRELLEAGAGIEARNEFDQTALIAAAKKGKKAVVKVLLKHGADMEARDEDGRTPLIEAAMNDHKGVAEILIGAAVDSLAEENMLKATDKGGKTALMYAVSESDNTAFAKVLLKAGADTEQQTKKGCTALIMAATYGHDGAVRVLLEHGATTEATNRYGRTPLMVAAGRGHEVIVKVLLEHKANVEAENAHGETSLIAAAQGGKEAVVKVLLEHGADIEAERWEVCSPYTNPKTHGPLSLVRKSYTALMIAKQMISAKDIPSPAEMRSYKNIITTLEAATEVRRSGLNTARQVGLMQAAAKGDTDNVRAFLEQGADPNAKNKEGNTPLIVAAKDGHTATVRTLLEQGANIDAKDKYDFTALTWAKEEGHEAIVAILEAAEAAKRRRLALGELPVATLLVLGVGSLLLLGYLLYQFKRRLTSKRRPVDTDLTDLESGLAPRE